MQATIIIHVSGPEATEIRFTPAVGPFRTPVAAGTVLGQLAIDPPGWTGDIVMSGADAASLSVNTSMQIVAAAVLTAARDYSATITATA